MGVPTHEEFRQSGMTGEAARFPRSRRQIRMFAAFLNVRVDQLPETFKFFANEHMRDAWERVEQAARDGERTAERGFVRLMVDGFEVKALPREREIQGKTVMVGFDLIGEAGESPNAE